MDAIRKVQRGDLCFSHFFWLRPSSWASSSNEDPAGEVYARMTKRAMEKVGIEYELRRPEGGA